MGKIRIIKPSDKEWHLISNDPPNIKRLKSMGSWDGIFMVGNVLAWAGTSISGEGGITAYWCSEYEQWVGFDRLRRNVRTEELRTVDVAARMWLINDMDLTIEDFLNEVVNG